jgi:type IV secretion system protein VirB9
MNGRAGTGWFAVAAFAVLALASASVAADVQPGDPRLREIVYDSRAVVTVPVKRGVVTLVVLDADESITEVAAGQGGDCTSQRPLGASPRRPAGGTFLSRPRAARTRRTIWPSLPTGVCTRSGL